MNIRTILAFFILYFATEVHSFPTGPPTSVCNGLIPTGHTGTGQESDPPGGFFVFTELLEDGNNGQYEANTAYDG